MPTEFIVDWWPLIETGRCVSHQHSTHPLEERLAECQPDGEQQGESPRESMGRRAGPGEGEEDR